MKRLSRRTFLETAGAVGAAAVMGLAPARAWPQTASRHARHAALSGRAALSSAQSVLRGLADFIDAYDGPAALLDGDFRVVRTSRPHQLLLDYDPAEVYGKSCEKYWSREMRRIIKGIGGLPSFRRYGIYCVDFTVVRRLRRGGPGSALALVSVGRTVAIGNPHDPTAYLTTSRLASGEAVRSSATIRCLDHPA